MNPSKFKKIVVDTDILIDYANGHAVWVGNMLSSNDFNVSLVLPTIVIAEYFTATSLDDLKEVVVADKMFSLFLKQDLTEEIAKILGESLRHKTYPSGASIADLIIASTAIYLDAELATNNKTHFAKIPDLKFFDPKKIIKNL